MQNQRLYTTGWEDYELIDAGGGKKLERWGSVITIRPEIQAYFKSEKSFKDWRGMANWEFVLRDRNNGIWKCLKKGSSREWTITYNDLIFNLKLTKFKHIGIFPEQRVNWDYLFKHLKEKDKVLNLFAYTGASSLIAKKKSADVLHVDSIKQLLNWARQNMESSELSGVKWVREDALKFISRESKRKNQYNGIIMDPPAWGIGVKNKKWKLEEKLEELIRYSSSIIQKKGLLVLNTYSPKVDYKTLEFLGEVNFDKGRSKVYELWMKTTTGKELFYGNLLRISPLN